jgi:anthranilate phosphoribosyltransferase
VADLSEIRVEDAAAEPGHDQGRAGRQPGPARDIVLLNAGAAIYVAGLADSLADGLVKARKVHRLRRRRRKSSNLLSRPLLEDAETQRKNVNRIGMR